MAFHALVFFFLPILSVAALGAYVGPDQTPAGVPAVLIVMGLASVVRRFALRADAAFDRTGASAAGRRISEAWPFALADPPPRRPLAGLLMSTAGNALLLISCLGGGLAANGVVLPALVLAGVDFRGPMPSTAVVIGLGVLAVGIGVPIAIVAYRFGPLLRDTGRRMRARDARTLRQVPGELPVLLLRSFVDDKLVDPRPDPLQLRYEERLGRALRQIGPAIAIGQPGERMGYSGAARFYVASEDWQAAIQYLMVHCGAVVVIVGQTEGLWWEIEQAIGKVPRERLLFFFPMVDARSPSPTRWRAIVDFATRGFPFGRRYQRMDAERQARFQQFRQRVAPMIDHDLPEDLANAFFLDFGPDGRPRVLVNRYGVLRNFMLDLIPRTRLLRFDMTRTLWPFVDKLYEVDRR